MAKSISQLVKHYLKELADFQPVWATALGISGQDMRVADFSEARIVLHLEILKRIGQEVKSCSGLSMSSKDKIEIELMKSDIQVREYEWGKIKKYRQDPSLYVGELIYGLWYLLLRIPSPSLKVEACLQRLKESRRVFEAAKKNLGHPPKLWTKIAIEEAQGFVAFLKDVHQELLRLAPSRRGEIKEAILHAEIVGKEFIQFLKGTLLKRSTGNFRVGREGFQFLLKTYHHYSNFSVKKVLKTGREQLVKIREDLQNQAEKINPGMPWYRQVEAIKKKFPSQKNLLQVYRKETLHLRKFIQRHQIVTLPRQEKLQVIETPVFTRNTVPYAAYVDPPMFSGKNHGFFFVTPVTSRNKKKAQEVLEEHNFASLKVTALHEGYPGHHLQFATQFGASGSMMKIYNCSSFYEGWALYCEEMMYEAGYYDAQTRLMQLRDQLWRACRILIDVGLHTGTMTDAEAVQFLVKELKMSPVAARADVNWYTMRPTVPQSYLTGMLLIRKLRDRYKKKLGKGFTLKKFHDAFLQYGAIPIPLVEKAMMQ